MSLALAPSGPLSRGRALVVDDDPLARALLATVLSRCGFREVVQAADGRAAYAAMAAAPVDLMLCDLEMPAQDGLGVLREFAAAGFRGTVVIVSGHATPVLAAAARVAVDLGCQLLGQLAKPVTPDALERLLNLEPKPEVASGSRLPSLTPDEVADALFRGRLEVHYQPIIERGSDRVWGYECLARLRDPAGALIAPDRFIAAAEHGGLADALLDAMVDRVCADAARLDADGTRPVLTINLSACNLDDLELPQRLDERFSLAGIAPKRVVLELTESRLLGTGSSHLEVLTRLRLHGFGLAIDDFGTGHSTLERLRDLPFTELKIDRGFVAGAHHDAALRAMLDHSTALGRDLGLRVIAEGVENAEEFAAISDAGCDFAQGYLFSRPLSLDGMLAWRDARSAATAASTVSSAASAPPKAPAQAAASPRSAAASSSTQPAASASAPIARAEDFIRWPSRPSAPRAVWP